MTKPKTFRSMEEFEKHYFPKEWEEKQIIKGKCTCGLRLGEPDD